MHTNRFDQYLEAEVLGAAPVKLLHMLYRGALDAVAAARRHLAAGEIAPRSRQIQKAWDIVQELVQSLDREQGGKLAGQLAALYVYMQGRLMEANSQQADAPLAEVETLLGTLAEAWLSVPLTAGVRASESAAPAPDNAYEPVSVSY